MNGAIIAGTHSGCGKTTITLGIMAALKKNGMSIQPFKTGPDFIDTGLHRLITGRPSRNLDLWMCGEEYVKECFYKYSQAADMAIVEGVMGLYDGEFNAAMLASILGLPVILVVDAYGMAESAGAIVRGFVEYRTVEQQNSRAAVKETTDCCATALLRYCTISGVIFNRVGSDKHYERLKKSVRDVKVLGYLPRDLNFEIPHRHLGLTVAEENPIAEENIERLADAVLKHVNIEVITGRDGCLSLHSRKASKPSSEATAARSSIRDTLGLPKSLQTTIPAIQSFSNVESGLSPSSAKIAVAYDKAFCFYYEDNLDLLKESGAEIIKFSPLSDNKIPDGADAVYIGGGYPELYAKKLSGSRSMLKSIKEWSDAGKPLYAECGGLMYLSKGIYDLEGNFFEMADILPFETRIKKGRASLGYREVELNDDCILGKKGERLRGHEFHYSEIKLSAISHQPSKGTVPDLRTKHSGVVESGLSPSAGKIYSVIDNHGKLTNSSGYRCKNTLASYVHLHFGSNPDIARNFINFITQENSWKTSSL